MKTMSDPTVSVTAKKLGLRDKLLAHINAAGIPLGKSTLDKLCMPSAYDGPPVEAWFGSRPIYDLDRGLEWARSRLTKTRIYKV
jgi:hypothetical protein